MFVMNLGCSPHFKQRGEVGFWRSCFSMPHRMSGRPYRQVKKRRHYWGGYRTRRGLMRRGQDPRERGRQHEAALHINTRMSPIPTKVYKPATVTPRRTSAMTRSDRGNLICLRRTALSRCYCPKPHDSRGNPAIVPAAIHKNRFKGDRQLRRNHLISRRGLFRIFRSC
jgi:hypothetical protein